MYAFWLESSGYRVTRLPDVTALSGMMKDTVDVLVIDAIFGLRDRTHEVARRLRVLTLRCKVRIIVLTGFVPNRNRQAQISGELSLMKPCSPQDLGERIEALLSDAA